MLTCCLSLAGRRVAYLVPAGKHGVGGSLTILASEGFETNESGSNAYGWSNDSISRTRSGHGALRLTAPSGTYYAEIHNDHDAYSKHYGGAGYSYFGGRTMYPGSA